MNGSNAIFILFPIITGAFFALNGAILLVIWHEIKSLRVTRHEHGNALAVQGLQIKEVAQDTEVIFQRLDGIHRRLDAIRS